MPSVKFYIDKRSGALRKTVLLYIHHDGRQVTMSSRIKTSNWSEKKGTIAGNTEGAILERDQLEAMRRRITTEIPGKYLKVHGRMPSMDELIDEFTLLTWGTVREQGKSFKPAQGIAERVTIMLEERKNLSVTTKRQFTRLARNVQLFCSAHGAADNIEHLDRENQKRWLRKYANFLIYDEVPGSKIKYENRTAESEIKKLLAVKNYFHLPIDVTMRDIFPQREFFRASDGESEMGHCTPAEIEAIRCAKLESEAERRAIDAFIFSCFTGLRHNEFYQLTEESIQRRADLASGDRYMVLEYVSDKTGKRNEVPLNQVALEIIQRWKSHTITVERTRNGQHEYFPDILIPVLSSDKSNENLHKVLRRLPEFDKTETRVRYRGTQRIEQNVPRWMFVTFHSARHSFGFYLLSNGVPLARVAELMNHATVSTTEKYYKHIERNSMTYEAFKVLSRAG
jgi:integrase